MSDHTDYELRAQMDVVEAAKAWVHAAPAHALAKRRILRAAVDALSNSAEVGCRVYWGSHGCDRPRGHAGPHVCDTCYDPADTEGYVGSWPYYGPATTFYGEDVADAADRMGRA